MGHLVREHVPADPLGQLKEFAEAVMFTASPISSYIFGQSLVLAKYVTIKLLHESV